jgi:hypothetical protein
MERTAEYWLLAIIQEDPLAVQAGAPGRPTNGALYCLYASLTTSTLSDLLVD